MKHLTTIGAIMGATNVHAASEPRLQLDIIFPKNNSIVAPVYPFPIVFRSYNWSAAAQYKPALLWSLYGLELLNGEEKLVRMDSIGWSIQHDGEKEPTFGHDPNTNISIQSVKLAERPMVRYMLEYDFRVGVGDCFDLNSFIYGDGRRYRGRIFFEANNKTGPVPTAQNFTGCGTSLGAVQVTGQNLTYGVTCPVAQVPVPTLDGCLSPVDQKDFEQISRVMASHTNCPNASWPLGTGRTGWECDLLARRMLSGAAGRLRSAADVLMGIVFVTIILTYF